MMDGSIWKVVADEVMSQKEEKLALLLPDFLSLSVPPSAADQSDALQAMTCSVLTGEDFLKLNDSHFYGGYVHRQHSIIATYDSV